MGGVPCLSPRVKLPCFTRIPSALSPRLIEVTFGVFFKGLGEVTVMTGERGERVVGLEITLVICEFAPLACELAVEGSETTLTREGVAGTATVFPLEVREAMLRGNELGGPFSEGRRSLCAGAGEVRLSSEAATLLGSWGKAEVVLAERPLMLALPEAVRGVDTGFTVVQPLMSLAFEGARGLTGLSEWAVFMGRETDDRVRVDASEGVGISKEFNPACKSQFPGVTSCWGIKRASFKLACQRKQSASSRTHPSHVCHRVRPSD